MFRLKNLSEPLSFLTNLNHQGTTQAAIIVKQIKPSHHWRLIQLEEQFENADEAPEACSQRINFSLKKNLKKLKKHLKTQMESSSQLKKELAEQAAAAKTLELDLQAQRDVSNSA